jgi:error-prone DNA polymerase
MAAFAELGVTTNFSFLRGASHPQEMVIQAEHLGLAAIGIADRNTFAGAVRAHAEAKGRGIRFLVGTRLVTREGFETLAYPTDRAAYGRLCRLLSEGNRRTVKGSCEFGFDDVLEASTGQMLIACPPPRLGRPFIDRLGQLAAMAPGRTYLAGCHGYDGAAPRRLGRLAELGEALGAPLVATADALYHHPDRRPLQDVVTCIREKCTIAEAGFRLEANAERHLKSAEEMARLFARHPEAVARTIEIAECCGFSLGELRYEYPDDPVPPGRTPQQHLEDLVWRRAAQRFPEGMTAEHESALRSELALIAELDFARYFLTVFDIVEFANEKGILCQGRGSAANSLICYCLGITNVDPRQIKLLFARFISSARGEPPDIDVDFEHERREEVIQHLYERYGRRRAAICATVIHYKSRSAIREVGKVLGLTPDITGALAGTVWGSWGDGMKDAHIAQAGLDPKNPAIRQAVDLAAELIGFPRHLSQHVGGFVLSRVPLDETVPIHNGAMPDRTFLEWDKDDIDALGLMKIDVLALGMLTVIRKALDLVRLHHGRSFDSLAEIPREDDAVYEMLQKADSVGVFQVESRAQMSMLPRLKPDKFYDLVIEVAIVRPGPIQGDMVHPYLRRREGSEPVSYPSPELEEVLGKTLGVPLFQEQAMRIAIVAAGFTPDDADRLRRAMATFKHVGTIHTFRDKFIAGMLANHYDRGFAERCFSQIEGFGTYGFPESHAAAFAYLVYVSAWLKRHYPDAFCAALLNSQPMGFYAPAQLVRDAREHDVEVRAADVNFSEWDCTLERQGEGHLCAVRLGLRLVRGLGEVEASRLMGARGNGYGEVHRLAGIAGLSAPSLEKLAEADAFRSMGLDRREALWLVKGLDITHTSPGRAGMDDLFATSLADGLFEEPTVALPGMPLAEHVYQDYRTTSLSLKAHPVGFFRPDLARMGILSAAAHRAPALPQNSLLTVAGLVLTRQMPGTAKNVVFLTLEDETGIANIIVWKSVFETHRRAVMTSRLLAVRGRLQRAGEVIHVLAEDFLDLSPWLRRLREGEESASFVAAPQVSPEKRTFPSRDFH